MNIGRHAWLRLTPAYSIKLVEEILQVNRLFAKQEYKPKQILDPFCGTATTGLVSATHGHNCDLYDINPFLVWFGRAKAAQYDISRLDSIYQKVSTDLAKIDNFKRQWIPPMKNIERWWAPATLDILSCIRHYISTEFSEPIDGDSEINLLWIAFARLCIDSSSADFSHISVSFKDDTALYEMVELRNNYLSLLQNIFDSAKNTITGHITIYLSDSRLLKEKGMYDQVITSPPYPNRISYIRELRPYMYWLKFLETGEAAGELDWKAIGGTWGSATSKLYTWEKTVSKLPRSLLCTCKKIKESDSKNGFAMSQYVLKFFDDMFHHWSNLRAHLNEGADINYILGNSSFYGNYVETSDIVQEILLSLGYSNVNSRIIRKRNCKNHLYEYLITALWKG